MYTTTITALLVALPFSLAADSILAGQSFPLVARQGCANGYQACGQFCIDINDTCCPDASQCSPGYFCYLGDNNIYGCCALGETCTGAAAQTTALITATGPSTPASTGPSKNAANRMQGEGAAMVGLVAGLLLI